MKYEIPSAYAQALQDIATVIHQCNVDHGWWNDLYEVKDILRGVEPLPEGDALMLMLRKVEMWFDLSKAALIHSEVSEMVEGIRKNTMDSHLPHRSADEVEGADVLIRLLDLMSKRDCEIGEATSEKFEYNQSRADHLPENREGNQGKLV